MTNEMASEKANCWGPPFSAVNSSPSSWNRTTMTLPAGPGPATRPRNSRPTAGKLVRWPALNSSSTTTCAYDLTGVLVCSAAQYMTVVTRSNGKSVFSNATSRLLFVSQCVNGKLTRTPLLDSTFQNYFWSYDNNGLKLLQLRFYQLPTTVVASGSAC